MRHFLLAAAAAVVLSLSGATFAAAQDYPLQYSGQEFEGGPYAVAICAEGPDGIYRNYTVQSNLPYSHYCYNGYPDSYLAWFWLGHRDFYGRHFGFGGGFRGHEQFRGGGFAPRSSGAPAAHSRHR